MEKKKIGGVANILGQWFTFPTGHGLGLVELNGRFVLVRFSCPLESIPPQGSGDVVASTDVVLTIDAGQLKYKDELVVFGSAE